jgi:hypothetical protein
MKIVKGFLVLVLAASLAACSNQQEQTVEKAAKATEQKKQENTSGGDKPEEKTETPDNMKKVGQEGYGYVNVPADWVKFNDVNANTSYQVSSRDGKQIVSIDVFKDAGQDATLETYGNIVASNMEKNGGQDVEGATVTLGSYQALQIYGKYYDGTAMLVAWVFKAEDGKYRYISAEGPTDKIMDVVGYIEKGEWSLN